MKIEDRIALQYKFDGVWQYSTEKVTERNWRKVFKVWKNNYPDMEYRVIRRTVTETVLS